MQNTTSARKWPAPGMSLKMQCTIPSGNFKISPLPVRQITFLCKTWEAEPRTYSAPERCPYATSVGRVGTDTMRKQSSCYPREAPRRPTRPLPARRRSDADSNSPGPTARRGTSLGGPTTAIPPKIKQVLDDQKTHPILEQMLRTIQGDAMREASSSTSSKRRQHHRDDDKFQ